MKQSLLSFLLLLVPILASADAEEINGIYYNLVSETKAAEVTENPDKYSGAIVIPESIEYGGATYSVTSIGTSAFADCSGLTSITIPNSVTSIGDWAFSGCSDLTSVTIGTGMQSIGSNVFWGCSNLAYVFCYAENVPETESDAFQNCYIGYTNLLVPNASIDLYKATAPWSGFGTIVGTDGSEPASADAVEINGVYYNLVSETKAAEVTSNPNNYSGEVVIPESVEYEGVTYSVTSIRQYAFYDCRGLTSVTIPNSVTSIGDWAFFACIGLTSVKVRVTDLSAFCNNKIVGLVKNYINKPITLIDNVGKEITEYIIPNDVKSIGDNAFYYCRGLTSVTIPNSVRSIGVYAFTGCSGLTSVAIPNSVTSIGHCAFFACIGLTSVAIPENVTFIGEHAFSGCMGLTSATIPNSVTSISKGAFYYCRGLTSVIIPNSVISIGDWAFESCSGLTSVTIPNSVTSIGQGSFCYCSSLTSVTIGSGIQDIGEKAFGACPELTDVYCYAENVPNTGSDAFEDSNIDHVTLHVPEASIDPYKATAPWSGFGTIVAADGSELASEVEINGIYYNLVSIAKSAEVTSNPNKYSGEVIIPESVEYEGVTYSVISIGDKAFRNCSDLTSVTIPNSVTSIGDDAFSACRGLTSVTIPSSVTSIGDWAFFNCRGLTSVTIPNGVTSIGNGTFQDCRGLTSVTILNSVTSIGYDAFYYCSSLTSVTIGTGIQSIGKMAFARCSELTDVYCYAENVPETESDAFEDSNIDHATLHVPEASIDLYKATAPWSGFGTIVGTGGGAPVTQKCATPVIIYENGKLMFACATEGVEYVTDIVCTDNKKFYSSAIDLTGTYTVSVYATKAGYENSDTATKEINMAGTGGILGDVNGDGVVNAADIVMITNIIMGTE